MADLAIQTIVGWPAAVVGQSVFLVGLYGRRWTVGALGLAVSAPFFLCIGLGFPLGTLAAVACLTSSAPALVARPRGGERASIVLALPSIALMAFMAWLVLRGPAA